MYRGLEGSRLQELIEADVSNRCALFPKVSEDDWRRFADGLHDYFQEAAASDPSVGIFGMTGGEAALANSLMDFLRERRKTNE